MKDLCETGKAGAQLADIDKVGSNAAMVVVDTMNWKVNMIRILVEEGMLTWIFLINGKTAERSQP